MCIITALLSADISVHTVRTPWLQNIPTLQMSRGSYKRSYSKSLKITSQLYMRSRVTVFHKSTSLSSLNIKIHLFFIKWLQILNMHKEQVYECYKLFSIIIELTKIVGIRILNRPFAKNVTHHVHPLLL